MRILMMAGNYAPEKTASAPLTTDFCRYLRASGHSVSVVTTFPHYPQWKIWKGYSGRFYAKETIDGIPVYRILNYIPEHPTSLKRVLYYGSFGMEALLPAFASGRPDLIVCVTPPLELALSAYLLTLAWRVPYVLWIKDLVPDVAIQLGMLKNRMLINLAAGLEQFAYAHAVKLVVICDSFAENISRKGVSTNKVAVVPQWADIEMIRPEISGASFRLRNQIESSSFVVLHAGNIGEKQRLELLIHAAKRLEEHREIQLVIVGDGARKGAVVAEAKRLKSSNVRFLPLQPEEQFAEMLASSDVLALHQDSDLTDAVIPSKLLTYMASGKPIVATARPESATGRTISSSGCGVTVEPGNTTELSAAIFKLFRDKELRARCGSSGRNFVCENFARMDVLSRLESLLYESAGIPRPSAQENNSAQPMIEVA